MQDCYGPVMNSVIVEEIAKLFHLWEAAANLSHSIIVQIVDHFSFDWLMD